MRKRTGLWGKTDAEGVRFLHLYHDGAFMHEPSNRPAAGLPGRRWRIEEANEYAKLVGYEPVGGEESYGTES